MLTIMQQEVHTKDSLNIKAVTDKILSVLDSRSRDVITRRFGLAAPEAETLEAIGHEYGITRERVRQIEANAKKSLAKLHEQLRPIDALLRKIFAQYGGLLAENHIARLVTQETGQDVNPNLVRFYLEILPAYIYVTKSSVFHPHWYHEQEKHDHVEHIVDAAKDILEGNRKPQFFQELAAAVRTKLNAREQMLLEEHIEAALVAAKDIDTTAFGQWGLTLWSETSPRGVADKAYAVLRHHGQPAHFREITTLINDAHFDAKRANAQTVHNELIKDNRFVLVGRGLYGLKEWGFITGTVADVLESILSKASTPMERDELIAEVLKQRMVKKNTILLSLQNTKRFTRVDKNKYALKTA
jgi:DNA-directed RNA polymerase delta subunit